jgi:Carboxypeptidase regulatory-like domain
MWVLLLAALLPAAAGAQETRCNINGIVQDSGGVVPGAAVRITNTATSQTQQLVTNSSGYFEAVLLNPGTYEVRVELQGYKTLTQSGTTAVGQTVNLTLTLDVSQLTEEVTVVAQSALLDATTVSSGQNFDRQMVEGLPMFSNMPIMLSRFTPGVARPRPRCRTSSSIGVLTLKFDDLSASRYQNVNRMASCVSRG